ncbi:MAG: TetR/AcrR family transcriptional regulator [Deltaproteobacteria bacterium]|nr:TetR/AcrR family transcriptional regulator [Deltaproteobacteria bacterium]
MTRRAQPVDDLTKGERTRKKLVDATAKLLRKQGYHATGLSEIVEESGAPRGSVYFHFPDGKDELAVAAIVQSGESWRARVETVVADAKDLGTAITVIVNMLADDLEASGWENGCPVAAVALESISKKVRKAVVAHYTAWQDGVTESMITRFGVPPAIAAQLATVSLAAIEGALLLARVHESREPLVTVGRALQAMAVMVPK